MRKCVTLIAVTVLLGAACAAYNTQAPEPAIDGKALFDAKCRCHRPDGPKSFKGKSEEFMLAGLHRHNMNGRLAKHFSDAEMKAMAKYVSSL